MLKETEPTLEKQLASTNRDSLTDAVIDILEFAESQGMSAEDVLNTVGITLEKKEREIDIEDSTPSPEGIDEFIKIQSRGNSVPGQSLTNNPDSPYPWERPAEFANPKDAMNFVISGMLQKDAMSNIIKSLSQGATVEDITNVIVYSGFTRGKYNADTMLLIYEPVMYTIINIGESANLKYKLDDETGNDYDNEEEQKVDAVLTSFNQFKSQLKNKGVDQTSMPKELAEEVKTKTRSLLEGDNNVVSE